MRRKRGDRAAALINVLLISVLAFGLMVVPMASWVFQMNVDKTSSAKDGSRRLAEAAAHLMASRLIKDPSLTAVTMPSLTIGLPSYPQGQGYLALEKTAADNWSIPQSFNNLTGTTAIPGSNAAMIPPERAHLVAVGRYSGKETRLEVVLNVPAFPYVIASSVPLTAVDGLKVFGIKSPAALSGGYASIPPNQRVPGHLNTNAPDASPGVSSLQLNGNSTTIEGDALSKGTISIQNGAVVKGQVRPQSQGAPLPKINLTSLDTQNKPGCNPIAAASLSGAQLTGFNRRTGDLNVVGGLDLQGAVLYVEGGLNISGGVKGKGAIVATGPVRIDGGGSLTGDNQTALVAGGPVTIQGLPGQPSEFRGLIYTEGNLDCRHTNLAGSVVVNNPSSSGGAVLEQVSMAESTGLASLSLQVTSTTTGPAVPRDPRLQSPQAIRSYAGGNALSGLTGPSKTAPDGSTQEVKPEFMWYPVKGDGTDMTIPPGFTVTHPDTTPNEPWVEIAPMNPLPADQIALGGVRQINLNPNDPITGSTYFDNRTVYLQGTQQELTDEASLRSAMQSMYATWFPSCPDANARIDSYIAAVQSQLPAYMQSVADAYNFNSKLIASSPQGSVSLGTTGSTSTVTTPWRLDLGDFYNLADRIRILSWKEI